MLQLLQCVFLVITCKLRSELNELVPNMVTGTQKPVRLQRGLFTGTKKPGKIPASVTDCNFSIQGIS
ncbi:hypothetical protein FQJ01_11960 [Escherichia coli]|nr:hypothetical protein [Escherichia coli]EFB8894338.1 hypothetical protein [Escherichia coli]EFN4194763.1 hypothetical protein [Escherichia coli]EFN6186224.1 hypothetical protein [Escherichia coli]